MEEPMTKWTLRAATLCAVLSLWGVSSSFGFDFSSIEKTISEQTLKNGLRIIVMENHDAPVVSFATIVNAGSVDDPKGYGGLAHMFEHLAFKGTTTLGTKDYPKESKLILVEDSIFMELRAERTKPNPDTARVASLQKTYEAAREASYQLVIPNEFGNIIEREGGEGLNAFTANDMTAYHYSLPSNKLELWMALESERFLNPVFREMYKERDVVAEERRMRTESSPTGRMIEQFLELSFTVHPYGMPGIGAMSDIQYYSRKEARAFFDKYYVPSNMVIAIVGDVKAADVFAMAQKYWGRIKYTPPPDRIATVEPPQIGERRMHPDRPAIDALLQYLASGRTSVLYKDLVKEKKAAVAVQQLSGFPGDKYPTLAGIYAVPAAGHTNGDCEKDILDAVEKAKTELISTEELAKIKAQAKAGFINQLKGNQGMAFQLAGYQLAWGDWRRLFKELDRINAVTPEDVQRVAKEYFTDKNRNVVMMNTAKS
jgi:predicted Zn-dependent peptidase